MKNPFVKNDQTGLIAAIFLGSLAAGAIAYLYLTEDGEQTRGKLKKKMKEKAKDVAASAVSKKTGISKKLAKKAADMVVN